MSLWAITNHTASSQYASTGSLHASRYGFSDRECILGCVLNWSNGGLAMHLSDEYCCIFPWRQTTYEIPWRNMQKSCVCILSIPWWTLTLLHNIKRAQSNTMQQLGHHLKNNQIPCSSLKTVSESGSTRTKIHEKNEYRIFLLWITSWESAVEPFSNPIDDDMSTLFEHFSTVVFKSLKASFRGKFMLWQFNWISLIFNYVCKCFVCARIQRACQADARDQKMVRQYFFIADHMLSSTCMHVQVHSSSDLLQVLIPERRALD